VTEPRRIHMGAFYLAFFGAGVVVAFGLTWSSFETSIVWLLFLLLLAVTRILKAVDRG
jgi:uncharacterized membrane protein